MKERTFFLNTILAVVVGVLLLAGVCVRVFAPVVMLPVPGIPELAAVSLIALLVDHYVTGGVKRCYVCAFVLAALTFGILPWAAGFAGGMAGVKLGLVGGVVFCVTAGLFASMQDRMRTGSGSKLTPVICAAGLYLAAQCFAGMIL